MCARPAAARCAGWPERTQVPTLALTCPIQSVVPVAPLRREEFGARRQAFARAILAGTPMPTPDTRSVATSAIDPISLGICPDIIPSTELARENISTKFDGNASQL